MDSKRAVLYGRLMVKEGNSLWSAWSKRFPDLTIRLDHKDQAYWQINTGVGRLIPRLGGQYRGCGEVNTGVGRSIPALGGQYRRWEVNTRRWEVNTRVGRSIPGLAEQNRGWEVKLGAGTINFRVKRPLFFVFFLCCKLKKSHQGGL